MDRFQRGGCDDKSLNIPIMATPSSEAGAAVVDPLSSPKVAESLGASLDMAVAEALADYCDKVRSVGRFVFCTVCCSE